MTRDTVFEHTGPGADGYRSVIRFRRGEEIALPYADHTVAVADLIGDGGA